MTAFGGGHGGWGGFGGGGHGASAAAGLPFAGVPHEMRAGVELLVAHEPEHPRPATVFRQQVDDPRPLTLRRLVAPHRGAMLLAAFLTVLETVSMLAGPPLTQLGIDQGIIARRTSVLVAVAALFLLATAATTIASALRVRWTGRLAGWVMHELRVRVFTHLQRLSLDYFTEEKAGVVMTRMTSDIESLQQLLQDGIAQFAVQGLTLVIVTGVLFAYDVRLALITTLLVVPGLTALSWWFRGASDRGYRSVRDRIAAVLADLSETLHGVRVVVSHNRQERNVAIHRKVVGRYRDANSYTGQVNSVYGPTSELLGVVAQGVLLVIGGRMVLHHQLTLGELAAFLLFLGMFFQPIQQLVQLYNTYQSGQAAVEKLRTLLATQPSVLEPPDAAELPPVQGRITFDDVTFGYDPARPVLRHVSLDIEPGETVAFVGTTGAGKSTIAKLVSRFYDPTGGQVLVDGHDLRGVTLHSLRSQLGVVPQEAFLFAGTVRDNIAFGRDGATEDDVWEAVRVVGLDDLVAALPQGLDTPVHERGQSLSSGERQLIALARAFLARPRVLVLDEATSNLDLESETKVERALDVLLDGRTTLLIAHRLSTAMRANRIVVVERGEIVEIGSHDELVAGNGLYARMFATWASHAAA